MGGQPALSAADTAAYNRPKFFTAAMATHLDLEEQEQLDQLKHFWAQYGNLITWTLVAVLGAFAAWNGWNYWQAKKSLEAAVLYEDLERGAAAKDVARVERTLADLQDRYARTTQAQQGALLAARAMHDNQRNEAAEKALRWVVDQGGDPAYQALARLRLAALALERKAPDEALKLLEAKLPPEFEGLAADRRGDVLIAQGKRDDAKAQYQAAWKALAAEVEYRRLVEAKLAGLGVQVESQTQEASK